MNPQAQFLHDMALLLNDLGGDPEAFHAKADDLLCKTLRDLGYGAGVDIFDAGPRWYA